MYKTLRNKSAVFPNTSNKQKNRIQKNKKPKPQKPIQKCNIKQIKQKSNIYIYIIIIQQVQHQPRQQPSMNMDIDQQLQLLQRQLQQVQQQKTNPLSQRTVAQILLKLQQEGLKFYSTTDGNEYITPAKLDQEIVQFVTERGRTKIGILPQILNLNHDLIESRINGVCNKSTHIRNGDLLLSRDYIRNFVHQLKTKLDSDGVIQLQDIALSEEFNMAFLVKIVQDNLKQLDAEVNGTQLVTKQYRRMKKRRILGFLLAISRPVNIDTILKTVKLSENNSQALIQQLIQQGKLKGRCQNSYYIPDKFSQTQKQSIMNFFETNGFIEFSMLQKTFLVPKPQQWLKKNLKGDFIFFQQVCFKKAKLESFGSQIQSMLKGEGFFQISNVIPFDLEDSKMEKLIDQICGVKQFIIQDGIVYSEQWLNKCVNQFRDKVIYDIFLNKKQGKGKKKGSKKQKQPTLTEQQLVQTLFDAGLAEYSVAEGMADSLLPLVIERYQQLKTKIEKQLTQVQGVLTNAFLKYKKCKTILKTPQSMKRMLNTIEKQKKKGNETWSDPDFGPSQNEKNLDGRFSLIYYDQIVPKQWPKIQNVKWVEVPLDKLLVQGQKSRMMQRSLVFDVLQIIDQFNQSNRLKLRVETPNCNKIPPIYQQGMQANTEYPPFCFRFCTSEKQQRYVIVDNKIPLINEQIVGSTGLNGLIEKAYAKLRYCYKGILGVGIQQTIFQLTGTNPIKIPIQSKNQQQILNKLVDSIKEQNLVIVLGEGVAGKKIKIDDQQTEYMCMKPYHISRIEGQETLYRVSPGKFNIQLKQIPLVFKNIFVIKAD